MVLLKASAERDFEPARARVSLNREAPAFQNITAAGHGKRESNVLFDEQDRDALRLKRPEHRRAVSRLMVVAGAEGPKWGRSPMLDTGWREFITLLGGAANLSTCCLELSSRWL